MAFQDSAARMKRYEVRSSTGICRGYVDEKDLDNNWAYPPGFTITDTLVETEFRTLEERVAELEAAVKELRDGISR